MLLALRAITFPWPSQDRPSCPGKLESTRVSSFVCCTVTCFTEAKTSIIIRHCMLEQHFATHLHPLFPHRRCYVSRQLKRLFYFADYLQLTIHAEEPNASKRNEKKRSTNQQLFSSAGVWLPINSLAKAEWSVTQEVL